MEGYGVAVAVAMSLGLLPHLCNCRPSYDTLKTRVGKCETAEQVIAGWGMGMPRSSTGSYCGHISLPAPPPPNKKSGSIQLCIVFASSLLIQSNLQFKIQTQNKDREEFSLAAHGRSILCSPGSVLCQLVWTESAEGQITTQGFMCRGHGQWMVRGKAACNLSLHVSKWEHWP